MKKVIKWGALALVLIVIAVGAIYYFYINSIVEHVVETQGTKQMNLKTELDSARVACSAARSAWTIFRSPIRRASRHLTCSRSTRST